jgi:hypothetical protein
MQGLKLRGVINMRRISVAFILILLISCGNLFGQAKVGTAGVQFLKIGVSARAVAMGEAFVAVANDASALFYNPAGLIQLKNTEVILSHIDYPAGVAYDFVGAVYPMPGSNSVVGLSIGGLWTDEMEETTPLMPYGTGRTFRASDLAVGATVVKRLTDKFTVGGTVKFINENLADEAAYGWTADVGTFYETGWKRIVIAMMITNFGPDMNFVNDPFPMPMNFKVGGSIVALQNETSELTFVTEFSHPNDNLEMINLGVEYGWKNTFFLRGGRKINGWSRDAWEDYIGDEQGKDPYIEYPVIDEDGALSLDGFSVGGGVNFESIGLTVDYAYAEFAYFGAIHRYTLGYTFKGF